MWLVKGDAVIFDHGDAAFPRIIIFSGYQEGMELLKICNQRIDTVEKKILALNEDGETYEF